MSTGIHWPNTCFVQSVSDAARFPITSLPQVAVAGHSNVGKSALLNALLGRKNLVKVSGQPGHTRLLNLFNVDERLLIVDLPGYGYAQASKAERWRWSGLIEHYLGSKPGPDLILMLMDIRHGPKVMDLQLIEWLNAFGLRWLPVATKADKLSGNSRIGRLREMRQALGGMLEPLPTSSLNKLGIDGLRTLIAMNLQGRYRDQ